MLAVPAFRKEVKWMDYVSFAFRELHLARKGINFKALNEELLSKERLNNQNQEQIRERIRLRRSFQKLLITRDSMTDLTKMALSPHLRSIFLGFKFDPVYLPEEKGLATPIDVDFWMRRFQAMSILGSRPEDGAEDVEETRGSEDGEETRSEDTEQTCGSQGSGRARGSEDVEETSGSQDGEETREPEDGKKTGSENCEETHGSEKGREARISTKVDARSQLVRCIKEAIKQNGKCQVHAEVKVLGYIHHHDLFDKAINSVGINKLCCPACIGYISVMDIEIQVGGTHNKWYSWHLCEDDKLLSLDQLRSMKRNILKDFKSDWMKHLSDLRQRSLSFDNHSESSSGDAEPEDDIGVFRVSYDKDKYG